MKYRNRGVRAGQNEKSVIDSTKGGRVSLDGRVPGLGVQAHALHCEY